MGYSNVKKGYKLFDLNTKIFYFSRDVQFFENVFPFHLQNGTPAQTVFPVEKRNDIYQDNNCNQEADVDNSEVFDDNVLDNHIEEQETETYFVNFAKIKYID